MRLRRILCMAAAVVFLAAPVPVMAEVPYSGYNYDEWSRSVSSPNGYMPEGAYSGGQLGVGNFSSPQDLFVDHENNVYVLDSGNKRVVVLDSDLKVKKVISRFFSSKGEEKLKEPKGIFVNRDGEIFIADRGEGKILVSDSEGNIRKVIGKPASDVIPPNFNFLPEKVLEDSSKTLYVLASGIYQGAITYDMDGNFTGFYGSNRVQSSVAVLADLFWKRFLTKEQREKMKRYIPIEYSNFDIDEEDFVYTCTSVSPNSTDELKKLNPLGINILKSRGSSKSSSTFNFGDLEKATFRGKGIDTTFVDIEVDKEGFIYGLDSTRGRIFQYDQECNLIFAFGGKGTQVGTFDTPVAVENVGGKVLILDAKKNNITVFQVTRFGEWVQKAVKLYNRGMYEEAVEPWSEVLKRDENYRMAYIGIGKALLNSEKYREAMDYFKRGYDKKGYSDAFKEYRTEAMRENFSVLILAVLLVAAAPGLVKRSRRLLKKYREKRGERHAA